MEGLMPAPAVDVDDVCRPSPDTRPVGVWMAAPVWGLQGTSEWMRRSAGCLCLCRGRVCQEEQTMRRGPS